MANNQSQAGLVWDEYKYRHTHCWKVVFQLTAAVVFLSAIPYIDRECARALQWRILLAPLLAALLAGFSAAVMCRELSLLSKLRLEHRRLQEKHTEIRHRSRGKSHFRKLVMIYLAGLLTLSMLNLFVAWLVWLPKVANAIAATP